LSIGRNIGSLRLSALSDETKSTTLWVRNGTQAAQWRMGSAYLNGKVFNYDLKLVFDGIIGDGPDGNMGLDESKFC
jgi:hypothetical protein